MLEELNKLGVNTEDGLFRFMNNSALYKRMLVSFAKMVNETDFSTEFDDAQREDETGKYHALKGVAGNLSIEPLFKAYSEIVSLLREGSIDKAKAVITKTLPEQKKITECIEMYS